MKQLLFLSNNLVLNVIILGFIGMKTGLFYSFVDRYKTHKYKCVSKVVTGYDYM